MKLRRVRFDRFLGPKPQTVFEDSLYELEYRDDLHAIRVTMRSTGETFYADQSGAEWSPAVPPKEVNGRPAAAPTGPQTPGAQRTKR